MENDHKNLMNDEHHYVTFNNYLKERFGSKVYRVSLNAGMTCPNRDGTKRTVKERQIKMSVCKYDIGFMR